MKAMQKIHQTSKCFSKIYYEEKRNSSKLKADKSLHKLTKMHPSLLLRRPMPSSVETHTLFSTDPFEARYLAAALFLAILPAGEI